jgi:hypothetical protein
MIMDLTQQIESNGTCEEVSRRGHGNHATFGTRRLAADYRAFVPHEGGVYTEARRQRVLQPNGVSEEMGM